MTMIRKMRTGAVAFALLASVACATSGTRRSTGAYIDDSVVTAKVKTALIENPTTKAYQIDVETNEGVVLLNGFVDTSESRSTATTVAKTVQGVREVRNNLEIKE